MFNPLIKKVVSSGGTLKIYGETLKPDVPYKTLLLSTADTVQHVIKEAMEKYGVDTEDTTQFVLVEVLYNSLLCQSIQKCLGDFLLGFAFMQCHLKGLSFD